MTRSMLTVAAALLALAAPALPAEEGAPDDPMAGWKPPVIKRQAEDRKEIAALLKTMQEAGKKGDLDAAVALVDFPVLMVTDDSKGEASAEEWTKEQWVKVMAPFYKKPMPGQTRDKPTIFLITDSLASVDNEWSHTMGKQTMKGRSSMLLVRKGGKWLVRAMVEGGWGDVPMVGAGQAPAGEGASGAK